MINYKIKLKMERTAKLNIEDLEELMPPLTTLDSRIPGIISS